MLTMPILAGLWSFAFFNFMFMLVYLYKRWWGLAAICYLLVGLFGIAVPFKIGLAATSILGMLFLSVVWPVWMLQTPLGFSMLSWAEPTFWSFLFDFKQ